MIWLTIVPSTMFAEVITLALETNDRLISFIPPQVFINMVFVAAIIPMLVVRGWKIKEVEKLRAAQSYSGDDSKVKNAETSLQQEQASLTSKKLWMRMFEKARV